jgi:hypothetical protein
MRKFSYIIALLIIVFAGAGCAPKLVTPDKTSPMADCSSCEEEIKTLRSEATNSPNEQIALVERIFEGSLSDTEKADAIVVLAGSPKFSCTAKMIILKKMKTLDSLSRRRILEAFYERGGCVPSGR